MRVPQAETLSHSPISPHSPQHSPIGTSSKFSRGMTSTITILPSSPLDLSRNPFGASTLAPGCTDGSPGRPKLSLNTACSQNRTLGKGNTGLRLDTLSASSPTIRNTFKNSYDAPTVTATPLRAVEPSQIQKLNTFLSSPKPPTPHPLSQSSPSTDSSQSSAASSPDTSKTSSSGVPYVLGKHPRSILTNSPLPKRPRSKGGRTVGFHDNLEEKIQTTKYTAQHYDLIQACASPNGGEEAKTGSKRESPRDEEGSEEDTGDESYPKTPVAGRKKRRREWVWTLGPIDGVADEQRQQEDAVDKSEGRRGNRPLDPPRIAVPRPPQRS